jgi:hypothetical protein
VTLLVLDCDLLADALVAAGDEDVIVVDLSAVRLERLEHEARDPRAFFLIGEPAILPLPDRSVDSAVGDAVEPELRRVLKG